MLNDERRFDIRITRVLTIITEKAALQLRNCQPAFCRGRNEIPHGLIPPIRKHRFSRCVKLLNQRLQVLSLFRRQWILPIPCLKRRHAKTFCMLRIWRETQKRFSCLVFAGGSRGGFCVSFETSFTVIEICKYAINSPHSIDNSTSSVCRQR